MSDGIIDLYERHARDFDRERSRSLQERAWLDRFLGHVRPAAAAAFPGAPLMFTRGTAEGEATGSWCGEALYHASLAQVEYETLLNSNGFSAEAARANDPDCGGLTVWLAIKDRDARADND